MARGFTLHSGISRLTLHRTQARRTWCLASYPRSISATLTPYFWRMFSSAYRDECEHEGLDGIYAVSVSESSSQQLPYIDAGGEGEHSAYRVSIDCTNFLGPAVPLRPSHRLTPSHRAGPQLDTRADGPCQPFRRADAVVIDDTAREADPRAVGNSVEHPRGVHLPSGGVTVILGGWSTLCASRRVRCTEAAG